MASPHPRAQPPPPPRVISQPLAPHIQRYAPPPAAMGQENIDTHGHLLGLSTVLVGFGSMMGLRFGGIYGGAAGGMFGGSAVNAYRAVSRALEGSPEGDREAIISGTYALLAAGLGGYLAYKAATRATPNRSRSRRAHDNTSRNCGFRPV